MSPADEPAFYAFDTPWTWNRYCGFGPLLDERGEEQDWTFNANRVDPYSGELRAKVVWPGIRPFSCMAGTRSVLLTVEDVATALQRLLGDQIRCVPTVVRRRHHYAAINVFPRLDCVDETRSTVIIGKHVQDGSRTYDYLGDTTLIRGRIDSHLFRLKYQ